MKNKRLLGLSTAFAIALAIGVTSCKKDKNDSPGESAKLSANIGGTAYQPNKVVAWASSPYIVITSYQIRSNDTVSLQMSFRDTVTVNSKLVLDDIDLRYFNTKLTLNYMSDGDSHGSVTFTTVDKTNKKIAGKFSGVIYHGYNDSLVVKDGQFNTTYQ